MSTQLDTQDWKDLKDEWREFRQARAKDRLIELFNYIIENHSDVRAYQLNSYQVRIEYQMNKLDFYPQKLRLFNLSTQKWFTLNRNHWMRDIFKHLFI